LIQLNHSQIEEDFGKWMKIVFQIHVFTTLTLWSLLWLEGLI